MLPNQVAYEMQTEWSRVVGEREDRPRMSLNVVGDRFLVVTVGSHTRALPMKDTSWLVDTTTFRRAQQRAAATRAERLYAARDYQGALVAFKEGHRIVQPADLSRRDYNRVVEDLEDLRRWDVPGFTTTGADWPGGARNDDPYIAPVVAPYLRSTREFLFPHETPSPIIVDLDARWVYVGLRSDEYGNRPVAYIVDARSFHYLDAHDAAHRAVGDVMRGDMEFADDAWRSGHKHVNGRRLSDADRDTIIALLEANHLEVTADDFTPDT